MLPADLNLTRVLTFENDCQSGSAVVLGLAGILQECGAWPHCCIHAHTHTQVNFRCLCVRGSLRSAWLIGIIIAFPRREELPRATVFQMQSPPEFSLTTLPFIAFWRCMGTLQEFVILAEADEDQPYVTVEYLVACVNCR